MQQHVQHRLPLAKTRVAVMGALRGGQKLRGGPNRCVESGTGAVAMQRSQAKQLCFCHRLAED